MSKQHPHILLFCDDEHAPQVMGCMGDPIVRTPNLDRLAARGVNFTNAYCNNPICVPGRYSTLTGKYVRDIGALNYGAGLDPKTWTYPKHFARAGYQTTCVGKMHFMGLEQMHGWLFRPFGDMELVHGHSKLPGFTNDPYKESNSKGPALSGWVKQARTGKDGFIIFDESVTREAKINLRDYFECNIMPIFNSNRPLLFEVSYKTPHWPFIAPQELFDYYRERVTMPEVMEVPDHPYFSHKATWETPEANTEDEILNARAAYWGLCEWVDFQIGLVMETLEELDIMDEFMIGFRSDHGEMAGEHGCWGKGCMHEWSSRIPFMLSYPGEIPENTNITENVSGVDLFPTLCDYAGLEIPNDLRGQSLRPLIDGSNPETFAKRTVISEFFGGHNCVMAKRGNIKLISYSEGPAQLFDLGKDPNEVNNLNGNTDYTEIQNQLKNEINQLPEPWRWEEDQEKSHHTPEEMLC